VNWYTEKKGLNDLYYMSIRLRVENRSEQHNIQVTKIMIDSLQVDEEVHGNNYNCDWKV
jgi:LacI family transcriptional regulator